MSGLTHVDAGGRAGMVDVGDKPTSARRAIARGVVLCAATTIEAVTAGTAPKGAVISTSELAGVMAAKRTIDLIPLCHPLPLTKVAVRIEIDADLPGFRIEAEARTVGRTGVEIEALTAVAVAGLTLYDMLKAIDREMEIGEIAVSLKEGGKSA